MSVLVSQAFAYGRYIFTRLRELCFCPLLLVSIQWPALARRIFSPRAKLNTFCFQVNSVRCMKVGVPHGNTRHFPALVQQRHCQQWQNAVWEDQKKHPCNLYYLWCHVFKFIMAQGSSCQRIFFKAAIHSPMTWTHIIEPPASKVAHAESDKALRLRCAREPFRNS